MSGIYDDSPPLTRRQKKRRRGLSTVWKIIHTMWMSLVAVIPTWIFVGLRTLLSPEGFWQEIVVSALGIIALGSIQIFFLVALIFMLMQVWSD